jgi:hypothetical protein
MLNLTKTLFHFKFIDSTVELFLHAALLEVFSKGMKLFSNPVKLVEEP